MEFTWHLKQLKKHAPCVVAIGSFDGVHRGHQIILKKLKKIAKMLDIRAVVLTFEPQPIEYLTPKNAPERLTQLREKLALFSIEGIENVACLRFNNKLRSLMAEDFVAEILVKKLGVKTLIIGDDFRLGKDQLGDSALLLRLGQHYGFEVMQVERYLYDGQRVSSTQIRSALRKGHLNQAKMLLGRPYCLGGRIVHGQKRGHQLGIPTANIHLHWNQVPITGIFAVSVHGLMQYPLKGIAYIGRRPVFSGEQAILEVHIFNFKKGIYGRYIRVELLALLRKEEIHKDVLLLQKQMQSDLQQARNFFACPSAYQRPKFTYIT